MLRHLITGVAATLASGILFYFGTGLHPIWYLTWLAPIPVLLFASRAPAWAAFVAALLAFLLGNTNMFVYAHNIIGLPLLILVPILVIPSVAFGIAVLLWRFCLRRGALWQAVLAFPCAWLAYEFLNASTSPHGTFGSLSYSQMDCLSLLQVAAITGLWGIVFTILLASATASVLLLPGGHKSKTELGLCVATVLAAVLGFGEWRLHADLHSTGMLKTKPLSTFPYASPSTVSRSAKVLWGGTRVQTQLELSTWRNTALHFALRAAAFSPRFIGLRSRPNHPKEHWARASLLA